MFRNIFLLSLKEEGESLALDKEPKSLSFSSSLSPSPPVVAKDISLSGRLPKGTKVIDTRH